MPSALSIFILKMIARLAQSTTLGTLDHFSHFTLFKFLKLFAKKNTKIRDKKLAGPDCFQSL